MGALLSKSRQAKVKVKPAASNGCASDANNLAAGGEASCVQLPTIPVPMPGKPR